MTYTRHDRNPFFALPLPRMGQDLKAQGNALGKMCRQKIPRPEGAQSAVPQSLAQILMHLVFSTKNREPVLDDTIHGELHAYIGGILANSRGTLLKAGSVADHIHLLIVHPRTCSPADLMQDIKTGSSKWLKTRGHRYRDFHWQSGYGIFSVSSSHRPAVESYLERQADHHRKVTFQDEYRALLEKHGITYDERYVWD